MGAQSRTSRRSLLGLLAGSSLGTAGCIRLYGGQIDDAYDLLLVNYDDTAHTISIEITEQDSNQPVLTLDRELGRKERVERADVFSKRSEYTVRASLDGGEPVTNNFDAGDPGNAPVAAYHVTVGSDGDLGMLLPAP